MAQPSLVQRYYNSNAGRFYTPDSKGMKSCDLKNPTSWNMYAYVNDDPVNFKDPLGTDAIAADDEDGPPDPGWPPVINSPGPPHTNNSAYPECNRGGNQTVENKLNFINDYYSEAMTEAKSIQQDLGDVNISVKGLATVFLQWSMWETGYGLQATATINNNYFGNGGSNAEYSVICPAGAASGPAYYSSLFDWGAQLYFGLSMAPHTSTNPNPNNLSYEADLEALLTSDPNASATQILTTIAGAGWNADPNYGNKIGGGAGFPGIQGLPGLINCLQSHGYI